MKLKNRLTYPLSSFCTAWVICWRGASGLMITSFITWMMIGVVSGFNAFFVQRLFDSATDLVMDIGILSGVLVALATYLGWLVLGEIAETFSYYYSWKWVYKTIGDMHHALNDKISRIAPEQYEDVDFLNEIEKARRGADLSVWLVWIPLWLISVYGIYFVTMGWYLARLNPWLILAMILSFIPAVISQVLRFRVFAALEEKNAPLRRENEYYRSSIVSQEGLKETRGWGGTLYFFNEFMRTLVLLIKMETIAITKAKLYEFIVTLMSVLGSGWMIWLAFSTMLAGNISPGAFAAVIGALGLLIKQINRFMYHIAGITDNMANTVNYTRFIRDKERGGKCVYIARQPFIRAEHISYAYPNTKKMAVDDVSCDIPYGTLVALVGENGSGKSTFIRLITGIYRPLVGRVLIGGEETTEIQMPSLFANISGVFQRFGRYFMLLKENISISNTTYVANEAQLADLAAEAGLDVISSSFPLRFETMLSREFGGVELSGGEWQRVALCRGLYRNHDILVLDEPTAAIDPIQETLIYKRFAEISKGKTAFIVTHRLGSTKLADLILVMKDGKIVERGNHASLLEMKGEYTRMFEAQAQWYT